jgi:hypothetical protein
MAHSGKAETINPPNMLRARIGGPLPALDQDAIARAEAALASMSVQFEEWINDEVSKLDGARTAARDAAFSLASLESLYTRAHDLKGLGATYGYPLVTRMAGSLCKLIDNAEVRAVATGQGNLVEAHVDAIKAVVRQKIKTDEHPVGKVLADELEARVLAGA